MKRLKKYAISNCMFLAMFFILISLTSNAIKFAKGEGASTEKTKVEKFISDHAIHGNLPYSGASHDINHAYRKKYVETLPLKEDEIKSNYSITSMNQIFTLDANKKSCDVHVSEKASFKFPSYSDKINYIIISKKTPLYGFAAQVVGTAINSVQVTDAKLYQDSSFRQRIFVDTEGRRLSFRDRWMVSVSLSHPVKEIEIEFNYSMQRAVLIDSIGEANYLKFTLINPLNTINNYKLSLNLLGFQNLKPETLKIPMDSIIRKVPFGIEIETKRQYRKHSEYEINLSLPYELTSCEGNIVNVVYYGLIAMSVLFIVMSIFTLAFVYKE
jgi:hypothetical protein